LALAEYAARQTAAMAAAHLMFFCIFITLVLTDLFGSQQQNPTPFDWLFNID
jgi:hypothetical protein